MEYQLILDGNVLLPDRAIFQFVSQAGKSYLAEKLLPLFFPDALFVTVKPEDLYSHGDIVFEYAFREVAKTTPSVLVLEDMQHPVRAC